MAPGQLPLGPAGHPQHYEQSLITYRAHTPHPPFPQFTDAVSDDVDVLSMAPWEQALWFVCTLLNMACLMLAWVYAFDIIAQVGGA